MSTTLKFKQPEEVWWWVSFSNTTFGLQGVSTNIRYTDSIMKQKDNRPGYYINAKYITKGSGEILVSDVMYKRLKYEAFAALWDNGNIKQSLMDTMSEEMNIIIEKLSNDPNNVEIIPEAIPYKNNFPSEDVLLANVLDLQKILLFLDSMSPHINIKALPISFFKISVRERFRKMGLEIRGCLLYISIVG